MSPVTVLSTARSVLGAAFLLFPALPARAPNGAPDPRARAVIRVLGARQLVQGLATPARPDRTALVLGAGVDAAHAASMVAVGTLSRRWRHAALADAATAAALAAAGLAIAWRAHRDARVRRGAASPPKRSSSRLRPPAVRRSVAPAG